MHYCDARLLVRSYNEKFAVLQMLSMELYGYPLQPHNSGSPYAFNLGLSKIIAVSSDDGRLIRFIGAQENVVKAFEAKLRSFALDHSRSCVLLP